MGLVPNEGERCLYLTAALASDARRPMYNYTSADHVTRARDGRTFYAMTIVIASNHLHYKASAHPLKTRLPKSEMPGDFLTNLEKIAFLEYGVSYLE